MVLRVAPAEASGLKTSSVDLITVAQALHWFDIERFFTEAERVLRPEGILSFWCYEHCRVDAVSDVAIQKIYTEVESCWPPERRIVEQHYAGVSLPFTAVPTDIFTMTASWTAQQMLGYMRTWSASQRYLQEQGIDPTRLYSDELEAAWGTGARIVQWPITLKVRRK